MNELQLKMYDDLKEYIDKHHLGGGIVEGEVYVNEHTKMRFFDELGNIFSIKPRHIKSGIWTPTRSDKILDITIYSLCFILFLELLCISNYYIIPTNWYGIKILLARLVFNTTGHLLISFL